MDVTMPSARPRCVRGNSSTTIVIATAHSAPRKTWAENCAAVSHTSPGERAVRAAETV